MSLCIVMPTLNEGAALLPRLQALQPLRARGAELVLVDGGSTDATLALASGLADRVLSAARGRAAQMNAGAMASAMASLSTRSAEHLLFLHADTQLPPHADQHIAQALAHSLWGRFDVRIDSPRPVLRLVGWMMNVRSRLTGIATGDQAIFVRRRVFEAVGGFAPLALMEDVDLSRRLLTLGAPACLRPQVLTSARRWEQHGVLRTVWLMWWLRAVCFLGRVGARLGHAHVRVDVHALTHQLARRYGYIPRAPAAVAVLAKAPVAGLAKTRLIPLLGAPGAARAQRRFTLHTLRTVRMACTGALTLWCAPNAGHRLFQALRQHQGVDCRSQPAGDLGQRMHTAMATHFAHSPHTPLLLVGTDCPVLTPAHMQQAADALQHVDAVLIPAEDGGYVLLGMRRPVPEVLVGVHWSTPQVLAQTRERLQQAHASWQELAPLWDVDEPADWQRLQRAQVGL